MRFSALDLLRFSATTNLDSFLPTYLHHIETRSLNLEALSKRISTIILGVIKSQCKIYLVMNLAEVLQAEGALSEVQVWRLFRDVLPALKLLHDRNLIHGDIQPKNILRHQGSFVLIDRIDDSINSPEYVAPEQLRGPAVPQSDLYSLGVTCIHLLTDIPPFDLFDVSDDCWVWQQYLPTPVSGRLTQILNKLLQTTISQRFQSADEIMRLLGINSLIATPPTPKCHSLRIFKGHTAAVNAIALSLNGQIASVSADKTTRLWDINTGKAICIAYKHTDSVNSVAFSVDGTIATASSDRTLKLWSSSLQEIFTFTGHTRAVKSVSFHPNGQILASGSWDKTIKLWNIRTGQEIYTFTGHQLQVTSVAFSSQGILASASFDRTIRLWQSDTWENRPVITLVGHVQAVLAVAFSPNGQILATGSDDKTIKLWDVSTSEVIHTLSGHCWSVVTVVFSADGETLISGSWDKTVKFWRVSTGEEIATFTGHEDSVLAVAVGPDAVASCSKDKTLQLISLPDVSLP